MKYAETVVILVYEFLEHFGRAQICLVLKLRLVDVIDDDLVFRVLLVFLINERHKIDILSLIIDLNERKPNILVIRRILPIWNSIKGYLFEFLLGF